MSQELNSEPEQQAAGAAKGIIVQINGESVSFDAKQITGSEIKQAAVIQGARIKLDYALAARRGHVWEWIGDEEPVDLQECDRFLAIEALEREDGPPCGCERPRTEITIKVNRKPVIMQRHVATGAQIKAAAITQGVNIKPDYVLSAKEPDGKWEVVPDDRWLRLHDCEQFMAVSPEEHA